MDVKGKLSKYNPNFYNLDIFQNDPLFFEFKKICFTRFYSFI
jgi:hypothetical protein